MTSDTPLEALRSKILHILITGEQPKGNLRVANLSLDDSNKVDAIMSEFKSVLAEAERKARDNELWLWYCESNPETTHKDFLVYYKKRLGVITPEGQSTGGTEK